MASAFDPPQPTEPQARPAVAPQGARTDGRVAAADYARRQIATTYERPAVAHRQATPVTVDTQQHLAQYHSAWQSYYQQYYQRYYAAQQLAKAAAPQPAAMPIAAQQDIVASEPMTSDRAGNEIRNELLEKVLTQSSRARKSRHFVPLVSAFAVMSAFVFLQFNQVLFAQVHAFVSPGEIDAQNIIIDPYSSTKVSQDPKIIIPKINVEAPVVYGVTSLEDAPVQKALHDGVVHYPIPGANSVPGQNGTSVVLGHSSSDVFDNGGYKFVFVQLDRLEKGDLFYMNYLGTRYTYSVTDKLIIEPNEVGKLVRQGTVPTAALVTCTPTGTALRRLVVFADQVSPSPEGAQAAPEASSSAGDATIPGNTPSLLQRLFGGQ